MLKTKFVLVSIVLMTILSNVSIIESQTLINQNQADSIEVDKNRVTIPCQPGTVSPAYTECDDNMFINVSTSVSNPTNKILSYNYSVSGGQVIGQGASISWNLTDLQPGTYTISANVSDGNGNLIKTLSKSITVEMCMCGGDCVCPTLTATASEYSPKAGSEVTFTVNVSGGAMDDLKYNWTLSKGEIIDGQGTPTIKVASTAAMAGQSLIATVEVYNEDFCSICNRSESVTIWFQARKTKKKKVSKNVY